MAVLAVVLKKDRMDVDIIKAALETLTILCTSEAADSPGTNAAIKDSNDLGIMFTEIYIKDASNVTLLLDILEEVDFYVRFYTVQLLTTLLQNSPTKLQECILTSPLGLSRLIDLLDDRREIIRNEGLLLLIALTQSNADIQKIIAFENAFERLLSIILEEGATDGGIIVQDCLQLTHNLLKYNVSNQNLFRETSCIQRIPLLLTTKSVTPDRPTTFEVPLTHESNVWTEQKIANTCLVLDLIRILVGPKNPNTSVNQNVMHQAKIIDTLIDAGLSFRLPPRVRIQALYALGDVIRGHKANQDLFSKSIVQPSPLRSPSASLQSARPVTPAVFMPKPAVFVLLQSAVDKDEFAVRAGAAYAFQCYLYDNPDSQLALVSTLTPPPPDNPNAERSDKPESPGSLLVSAIMNWDASRKDPFRCWFACVLLAHIVHGNPEAQRFALATKFDEGEEAISLLHKCMFALVYANRENADVRVQIGLLCLMCTWLYDSTEAVKEFLTEGSNVQFLVEQINQSSGVHTLVQGLAAYLLGLVYEYNDDSESTFTKSSLQSLIISRVGADVYISRIERLRESKEFNSASTQIMKKDTGVDADGHPEVYFDYTFVELLKSTHDQIARSITTTKAKGTPKKGASEGKDNAAIQPLKDTIASQGKEIDSLRKRLEESEARSKEEISELQRTIEELKKTIDGQAAQYDQLEKEQEDLLVLLADQDAEKKQLKGRLRALGQVVEDDDEEDEEE
ncbi:Vesicle-mediated ER to Golgi transport protein [Rhizophlyctis rosea]|nr:Vesicle-mediated ER to Golgi transport protein [Rhizophlyctis rosea]